MKFWHPNYNMQLDRNASRYLIDWDAPSRSKFQFEVKQFLKPYWEHCYVVEEFTIPRDRRSIDIINFTYDIAIEVQGAGHTKFSKGWFHKTRSDYLNQKKRDFFKRQFCEMNDLALWEIFPEDMPLTENKIRNMFNFDLR